MDRDRRQRLATARGADVRPAPPALFSFLQSTEQQDKVYGMKRDKKFYKLTMLDTVLTYNIQTGSVTYPEETPA